MKYIKQLAIIFAVTAVGEILKYLLPLPIPASIYGLVIMLALLMTKTIKLEQVKATGEYLIEIMPLMFIPASVGLMASWGQFKEMLIPLVVISLVSTMVVVATTGKVSDFLLNRFNKKGRKS